MVIAFVIAIPIDRIVHGMVGVSGIANLTLPIAVPLVLGSMALTLIAGFIPSKFVLLINGRTHSKVCIGVFEWSTKHPPL